MRRGRPLARRRRSLCPDCSAACRRRGRAARASRAISGAAGAHPRCALRLQCVPRCAHACVRGGRDKRVRERRRERITCRGRRSAHAAEPRLQRMLLSLGLHLRLASGRFCARGTASPPGRTSAAAGNAAPCTRHTVPPPWPATAARTSPRLAPPPCIATRPRPRAIGASRIALQPPRTAPRTSPRHPALRAYPISYVTRFHPLSSAHELNPPPAAHLVPHPVPGKLALHAGAVLSLHLPTIAGWWHVCVWQVGGTVGHRGQECNAWRAQCTWARRPPVRALAYSACRASARTRVAKGRGRGRTWLLMRP